MVSNAELLQEYERLLPQHASKTATRRALGLRYGLSENAVRWRLRRAGKRQAVAQPSNVIRLSPIIDADDLPLDAVPGGFFVKRMSTAVDKDGNVQEQWLRSDIESKRTAEIQDTIPAGHRLKGVSTYLDEQGRVRGQWVKTDLEKQQWHDLVNAAIDRIGQVIHPLPPVPRIVTPPANDLLALYPLADLHIGLYAAAIDAERDWRLADAVALVRACIDDLIERTPPCSRAIVANLGDFTHIDNQTNRTPNSGAALDASARYIEVVQAAMDLAVHVINRVAEHHQDVTVVWEPGNHDENSALVMQTALALLYRDDQRVTVYQSGKRTTCIQHKGVALGFTHGDTNKPRDLPMLMANDHKEIWAATDYRVWHCGHRHHREVQEIGGVIVETHQSPAPGDAWHTRQGYRSGHSMCAILYDGAGECARNVVQVRRRVEVQPAVGEVRRAA